MEVPFGAQATRVITRVEPSTTWGGPATGPALVELGNAVCARLSLGDAGSAIADRT